MDKDGGEGNMRGLKRLAVVALSVLLVIANITVYVSAGEDVGTDSSLSKEQENNSIPTEDIQNDDQGNELEEENQGEKINEDLEELDQNDISEGKPVEDGVLGISEGEEDNSQGNVLADESTEEEAPIIMYRTHVQSYGWNDWTEVSNMIIGTEGQSKRLEALQLKIEGLGTIEGGIEYEVHAQSYGWMGWKKDGEQAGSVGLSKRLEAVRIRLTGKLAEKYDVYYRPHVESYGWLGWATNGEKAGSCGYSKRLEALEIQLVKKGDEIPVETGNSYRCPKIVYKAHSQSIGWQSEKMDNMVAGVSGQSKRMEAIEIWLPDREYEGAIEYQVHVESYGWMGWKKNGEVAGTIGKSKRIEAIQIRLTGEIATQYDIYYSVHLARIGWTNYATNGEIAGSTELSKRIEAIKIQLVKKGDVKPDTSGIKYIEGYKNSDFYYKGMIQGKGQSGNVFQGGTLGTTGESRRLENIALYLNRANEHVPSGIVKYSVHLSGTGWTGWTETGNVSGCTDGKRGMEAIKISLSGDISQYYSIYYRTYVQNYGWLGWAKDGQAAGTTKCGYRLEAIQIKLVSKDANAPGNNSGYYTERKINRGPDAGMYAKANLYSSITPYIIMVNRNSCKVGVYKGWRGNWSSVKYFDCTVGKASTPTVSGVFKIGSRGYYFDSGSARCFWWTQFYGDYLFHSVLYNRNGTLQDGRLGMALSHGCVRLQIDNAKWIYDNIPSATTVVVY